MAHNVGSIIPLKYVYTSSVTLNELSEPSISRDNQGHYYCKATSESSVKFPLSFALDKPILIISIDLANRGFTVAQLQPATLIPT